MVTSRRDLVTTLIIVIVLFVIVAAAVGAALFLRASPRGLDAAAHAPLTSTHATAVPGGEPASGGTGDATTTTTTGDSAELAVPDSDVPPEVTDAFGDELDSFSEPLPPGVERPRLEMLVQGLRGSTFVSEQDGVVTVRGIDTGSGEPALLVLAPGNVEQVAALDWHCAWLREYLDADAAHDDRRLAAARTSLERSTTLGIDSAAENLLVLHRIIDVPLFQGDTASAEQWTRNNCAYRQDSE